MQYLFDKGKNEKLKRERGIGFEEMIELLETQHFIVRPHGNQQKYAGQSIIEMAVNGYIWQVVCIIGEEYVTLKTMYPSRKATKYFKKGKYDGEENT